MDTDRPADQQNRTEEQRTGLVIPPPAQVPPPSTIDEQTDAEIHRPQGAASGGRAVRDAGDRPGSGWSSSTARGRCWRSWSWPAASSAPSAAPQSAPVGPAVSGRFAGAWRELVDHARDLGQPIPVRGRRDPARAVLLIVSARRPDPGPPGRQPGVRAAAAPAARGRGLLARGRPGAAYHVRPGAPLAGGSAPR